MAASSAAAFALLLLLFLLLPQLQLLRLASQQRRPLAPYVESMPFCSLYTCSFSWSAIA
jgi:hypothetical protein